MSDSSATVPLDPAPTAVYVQPKKKHRWPWVLLVVLLVLGGAAVGGEFWARSSVENTVRSQAITALGLPQDQQIAVETQGLVLPQVIGGTLTSLAASSENVTLGPITGNVSANATDVPIRGGEPVGSIDGTIVIAQDELLKLLKDENIPLDNVVVQDGQITGEGDFNLMGLTVPVSVTLGLSVDNGTVMVTPISAKAGGVTLDGDKLRDALGGLGGDLLGPYPVCIAQYLPKAVTVTGVALGDGNATVDIAVDGNITTDPSLADPGVCS